MIKTITMKEAEKLFNQKSVEKLQLLRKRAKIGLSLEIVKIVSKLVDLTKKIKRKRKNPNLTKKK
jgi:hypothetical protein